MWPSQLVALADEESDITKLCCDINFSNSFAHQLHGCWDEPLFPVLQSESFFPQKLRHKHYLIRH